MTLRDFALSKIAASKAKKRSFIHRIVKGNTLREMTETPKKRSFIHRLVKGNSLSEMIGEK